jgi:hypothetical protein
LHWYTIFQLALTVVVILCLWGIAGLMFIFAVLGLAMRSIPNDQLMNLTMLGAAMAFAGLLLLPGAGYALARLLERPAFDPKISRLHPAWWIAALPVILLLGYGVSLAPQIAWLVLPFFHIMAVALPVAFLVYLAVRGLPLGSLQRRWGVLSAGLVLGPFLIMIAEIAAGLVFLVVGVLYISSRPELMREVETLVEWVSSMQPTPEMLLERLTPLVTRPTVAVAIVLFAAVIVPLIEEALKVIGVWMIAGGKPSPAAGWAAGAISGAGYALFESMMLAVGGEVWITVVLARLGTAVMHITTAGMMGWGLALSWRSGRYLRLGLVYLGAVLVHGLWNGLAIVSSLATLRISQQGPQTGISGAAVLSGVTGVVLLALAVSLFFTLIGVNRRLAAKQRLEAPVQSAEVIEIPQAI